MQSILVKDYMDHNQQAVNMNINIHDLVGILLKAGVSGLPVVDNNNELVGFVSEQDCIKELLNDAFYCGTPLNVSEVMTRDLITVAPNTSIVEIAQLFLSKKLKLYPVVENGKLVGVIKRNQVLRALVDSNSACNTHHG